MTFGGVCQTVIEIISTNDNARLSRKLEQIRGRNVALNAELMVQVAAIIEDVRRRGGDAPRPVGGEPEALAADLSARARGR